MADPTGRFGRTKCWGMIVFAALAAALPTAHVIHERERADLLLRLDPNAIPGDPALSAWAADRGRGVYDKDCAGCHGSDLRGDRRTGVPDLTSGQYLYGTGQVSDFERTIAYGIRSHRAKAWNLAEMPAFATPDPYPRYRIEPLRPGQIDDVIAYLTAVAGRPADQAEAARGDALYHNEGACFDCHGNDAAGDSAVGAPSLIGANWVYGDGSHDALFASIAQGRHGVCPGWGAKPDPLIVRALAVYVHARAHADKPPA